MPETIVLGYDGSDCADAALDEAVRLAAADGSRIVVAFCFHVWPGGGEAGDFAHELERMGREVTATGVRKVEQAGVEAEAVLVDDRPAEGLAAIAERRGARLIVVGTQGEHPIAGAILGSVPHKLLHISRIPVLVVPSG